MAINAKYQQYQHKRQVNINGCRIGIVESQQLEYYQWYIGGIQTEERMEEFLQTSFKKYSLLPIVDYNIDHSFTYVYTPYKQTLRMYLSNTEVNEFLAFKIIQKLIAVIQELGLNLNLTLDTIFLHMTQDDKFNLQIFPPYFGIGNQNALQQLGKIWYFLLKKEEYVNQPLIFPPLSVHNNIQLMLFQNSQIVKFLSLIPNHYHLRQLAQFQQQVNNYENIKQKKNAIDEKQQQYNLLSYKNIDEVRQIKNLIDQCLEQYYLLIHICKKQIWVRQFVHQSPEYLNQQIEKIARKITSAFLDQQGLIALHNAKLQTFKTEIQTLIDQVIGIKNICQEFQVQFQDIESFSERLVQTQNGSFIFQSILLGQQSYQNVIRNLENTNAIQNKMDVFSSEFEQKVRTMMEIQRQQYVNLLNGKQLELQQIKIDLQNLDISQERYFIVSKLQVVNELKEQGLQQINVNFNYDVPNVADYTLGRDINRSFQSYLQQMRNKVLHITVQIQRARKTIDDIKTLGIYQPRNEAEFQQNLQSLRQQFVDPHPFELAMIADRKELGYKEFLRQKISELLNIQQ